MPECTSLDHRMAEIIKKISDRKLPDALALDFPSQMGLVSPLQISLNPKQN